MIGIRKYVVAALVAGIALPAQLTTAGASVSVGEASRQLEQAQAQLAAVNDRLETSQARLDQLQRQLDEDQASEKKLSAELGAMARFQYSQPSLPLQVLSAGSLAEVFGRLAQARVIGDRQHSLLDHERQLKARDQAARDEVKAEVEATQKDRDSAARVAAAAQATLASARDEAARQQAASVLTMATSIVNYPTRSAVRGSPGNHFAYGYCTWYVANRRPIPWFGNAIEWWPNARAYGYAEGYAPAVGAVMVTRESGYGHVAYVESVNGDGSWTVSEMNYAGWGIVSQRTLRPGQTSVVGFIY